LSGEGYRGHIFWDAEIFMLPFYAYVYPEAAKNMLQYRYNRLEQARNIAKEHGYKGAMFPWESAGTGEEETPTWSKDLDGSIIRIRTNEFEHHITADIAYACHLYYEVTNDQKFMKDYGYEMMFETARFWASRVEKRKSGKYGIKNVIGPDEFHEKVNNNAFTNYLARWNLSTAYKLFCDIQKKDKAVYTRLKKKLGLSPKEATKWRIIAHNIIFKIKKDSIIEQFDGFFRRKHIKVKDFDENGIPMLPKGVQLKDYNETQFVKQADVLMLMYLFSHSFLKEVKERNFWYYVERTLHKSSLSAAMHALVALDVRALSHAYRFFNVALRADISNLHGNSAEGIHAASLGGVWQSVIHGFAGTRIRGNVLVIDPFMPKTWRNIKFSLLWGKKTVNISAHNDNVRLKINAGQRSRFWCTIFGKNQLLYTNKEYTFQRKKIGKSAGYY